MLLLRMQISVLCSARPDPIYLLKFYPGVLQTLYRSLIECHFRCGDIVWGNCETLLNKYKRFKTWQQEL